MDHVLTFMRAHIHVHLPDTIIVTRYCVVKTRAFSLLRARALQVQLNAGEENGGRRPSAWRLDTHDVCRDYVMLGTNCIRDVTSRGTYHVGFYQAVFPPPHLIISAMHARGGGKRLVLCTFLCGRAAHHFVTKFISTGLLSAIFGQLSH